jgi:hypothetical protein
MAWCRYSRSIIVPILTVCRAEVLLVVQMVFTIDMHFYTVSAMEMAVILRGVSVTV